MVATDITVYLVSATALGEGAKRFLSDRQLTWTHDPSASDSELAAEMAGRVCYMSFGSLQFRKSTQDYIANIIGQGHESVLEHANFGLMADGISRALTHQLVRHRVGFAYSQLSQQYHDESTTEFLAPDVVKQNAELAKKWSEWRELTLQLYGEIQDAEREHGLAASMSKRESARASRSAARTVLPNAARTTLMVTGNARAWLHLLRTRAGIQGDVEMREYCLAVWRVLHDAAPIFFDEFEVVEDAAGPYVSIKST